MNTHSQSRALRAAVQRIVLTFVALVGAPAAWAQGTAQPSLEVYGFGMADAIIDFNQNHPDWYDAVRPSRLPKYENEFGKDGRFYLSPRQTRFGVRASSGEVKAQFEFDMFGVGADAGLTTIRLRHAWGQWRQFGAGQTNSQFMDVDVFPNTVEYWGPNGMLFLRNTQVFWEPIAKADGTRARIAIEAPGASGDAGVFSDRVELQNVQGRYPAPDFTGHYRLAQKWGYVQVGGALRYIAYDDLLTDQYDLSGHTWGGGVSVSSNVKVTPNDVLRLQGVWGAGIANYFNDAPIDVGVETQAGNPLTPVKGKALPIQGYVAYLDHNWNRTVSTAIGYSRVDFDNSNGQAPNAYKSGQYFSGNVLCAPVPNVLMGVELLWAHRENFSDGFSSDDTRIQFSFKYSFSHKFGG